MLSLLSSPLTCPDLLLHIYQGPSCMTLEFYFFYFFLQEMVSLSRLAEVHLLWLNSQVGGPVCIYMYVCVCHDLSQMP